MRQFGKQADQRDQGDGPAADAKRLRPATITVILAVLILIPTLVVTADIFHDHSQTEIEPASHERLGGLWRMDCESTRGMLIEFRQTRLFGVTGRVWVAGQGRHHGYRRGQTILLLNLGTQGAWQGLFHWRKAEQKPGWRFVSIWPGRTRTVGLSAKGPCYERLERAG